MNVIMYLMRIPNQGAQSDTDESRRTVKQYVDFLHKEQKLLAEAGEFKKLYSVYVAVSERCMQARDCSFLSQDGFKFRQLGISDD